MSTVNISIDDREVALNQMTAYVLTLQLYKQTNNPEDKRQALLYKNEARRLLRLPEVSDE